MQSETEFLNIGTGFLDTFRYKKAIDYFTKAIEINPKNSQIFELRGIAWFRIFNIDQALNDTSKAIELDEENHAAWYNKGEILKFKNEYEAAEACYNQANKMYAGSFFYLTGLIQTCYSQKKYNETIEYCNQILNELTTDDIALSYRGLAYAKQLNYTLAIRDYLKLVETRKPDATNYCNLGHWYSKIGELKKAYNNLSVSLQLNPTHPYALNNLGYVKYLEGQYSKALELIQQSLDIDSSNSYAYKNKALVFLKIGQPESALANLQKSKLLGYEEDYGNEVNEILSTEFSL